MALGGMGVIEATERSGDSKRRVQSGTTSQGLKREIVGLSGSGNDQATYRDDFLCLISLGNALSGWRWQRI
jgi:hypothetical protein